MANSLLIVEGVGDQSFINAFLECEGLNIDLDVRVVTAPDIDSDINYTTKQAVFQSLSTVIKQLNDGRYTRIGILVAMDYAQQSRKPIKQQNLEQLSSALNPHNFRLDVQSTDAKGLFFRNPDFDHPIAVWLMPNNQDEGYLEDWIESCIADKQASYFDSAEQFVNDVSNAHLKPHVTTKAKVYTWLAIQPKPSQDLSRCLSPKYDLVDRNSTDYQKFKHWLIATFG